MRQLTRVEIAYTAFKKVNPNGMGGALYTSSRDKNEMCKYCYNEDTDVVRDKAYLQPFVEFYDSLPVKYKFKVVSCWCCEAVWSFYWESEDE